MGAEGVHDRTGEEGTKTVTVLGCHGSRSDCYPCRAMTVIMTHDRNKTEVSIMHYRTSQRCGARILRRKRVCRPTSILFNQALTT